MKKSLLVLFIIFCTSLAVEARQLQVKGSVKSILDIENPYKGLVQAGIADETISVWGLSLSVSKRQFLSTPFEVGLNSSFETGMFYESLSDASDFCETPCQSSSRSDIRVIRLESSFLYQVLEFNSLSLNTGLRGGVVYLSLRERIIDTINYSSEFALTVSPVIDMGIKLSESIDIFGTGFFQISDVEINNGNTDLPINLSGLGFSAGLSYNFN